MQADFADASERHWDDAEILLNGQRWANADHLYGFSAECGLKRLMVAFGMQVELATGSPTLRDDRVHADKIWMRFESYRNGNVVATAYTLPDPDPFSDWSASDRYANRGEIGEGRTLAHRGGAKAVRDLLKQATLDGVI